MGFSDRLTGARRWWWVLLAVSITANVFFLGGLGFRYWERSRPPPERGQMAERLKLTADQQQAFQALRHASREHGRAMARENRAIADSFWDSAAAPHADRARLESMMERMLNGRRELQRTQLRAALDFADRLDARQRAEFIAVIRQRWEPPGGPRGDRRGDRP